VCVAKSQSKISRNFGRFSLYVIPQTRILFLRERKEIIINLKNYDFASFFFPSVWQAFHIWI
jgi:hypothetical protein